MPWRSPVPSAVPLDFGLSGPRSLVLRLRRASASRESSDIEGVVVVDIEVSASASSAVVGRVPMLGVLVKVGLHTQQAAKKTEHPLLPPAERWEGGGVR